MSRKVISLLMAFCLFLSLSSIQSLGYAEETFSGGSGTSSDPYLIANRSDLDMLGIIARNGRSGMYFRLACDIDLKYSPFEPIGNDAHPFEGIFDGAGYSITGLYVYTNDVEGSGLFGVVKNGCIQNLYVSGEVWGGTRSGGIIGTLNEGQITNCSSDVKVMCSDTSESVGGIVGACLRGQVSNCYSTNYIYGGDGAGGIIGTAAGGAAGLLVSNCFSKSNISGRNNSGGIIGAGQFGGLVIENCYNTGTISASADGGHAGGIAGQLFDNQTLVNNYYQAGSAAGAVDSAEIEGAEVLTSGQMQTSSFASKLGSAFIQSPTVNDGYPILASMFTKQIAEIHINSENIYLDYSTNSYDLGVTHTGDGTPQYISSNPNAATVNDQGFLIIHSVGNCSIEISMASTDMYYAAESKTIQVYITPGILEPAADELPKAMTIRFGQTLADSQLSNQ